MFITRGKEGKQMPARADIPRRWCHLVMALALLGGGLAILLGGDGAQASAPQTGAAGGAIRGALWGAAKAQARSVSPQATATCGDTDYVIGQSMGASIVPGTT